MPQDAKNGDFRELFPISTPSFPTTCMGFEPPKAITLHLIVFKMIESIIRQGFYTYSASPRSRRFYRVLSSTILRLVTIFIAVYARMKSQECLCSKALRAIFIPHQGENRYIHSMEVNIA
jgi:hypothetical protein